MTRDAIWEQVKMAWAMLSPRDRHDVGPRERPQPPPPAEELPLHAEGFAEEAIPWLDAVYGFAIRLTRGDAAAAEDLVQETFLRAHRFWNTYERGSNAKSWLFTICRNTFLHGQEKAVNRYERLATDVEARAETHAAVAVWDSEPERPDREFFDQLIADEVIEAIDGLPDEFREVLVLSDMGDLRYAEIAQVLDVPVGTVKSRLFRARRILQEKLRSFAVSAGYVSETEERSASRSPKGVEGDDPV